MHQLYHCSTATLGWALRSRRKNAPYCFLDVERCDSHSLEVRGRCQSQRVAFSHHLRSVRSRMAAPVSCCWRGSHRTEAAYSADSWASLVEIAAHGSDAALKLVYRANLESSAGRKRPSGGHLVRTSQYDVVCVIESCHLCCRDCQSRCGSCLRISCFVYPQLASRQIHRRNP